VIESTVKNPIAETAVGDEFGKEPGNTADPTNKITGNDIGMQSEFNPRLGLFFLTSFSVFRLKKLWFRTLDGEVHIPFTVIDTVNNSDSPLGMGYTLRDGSHFVHTENKITDIPKPGLGGKGFGFFRTGNLLFGRLLLGEFKTGVAGIGFTENRLYGSITCRVRFGEDKDIPALLARRPLADQRIVKIIRKRTVWTNRREHKNYARTNYVAAILPKFDQLGEKDGTKMKAG
jgi:hypothetical protein